MYSGWCFGYDTVLMHRHTEGNTLYICEQLGVYGKLYASDPNQPCIEILPTVYVCVQKFCRSNSSVS